MAKWEEYVRKVVPYTPGEQPKDTDIIKLNTNENPYPPCSGVRKVIKGYECGDLRLYPDPNSTELVKVLAERLNVSKENIFVGVGSDDVISMAFLTFFGSDKPILFPDITYSFYKVWADVYKIPYRTKPLDERLNIKIYDYYDENGGIIFPNPNAPTGVFMEVSDVEDILAANKNSVVIIDEAYIDFVGNSCIPLIEKYDNLLVVQTFSKSRSLAGARIGYAVGNKKLIKCLNDVRFSINSYTMNSLSQECGVKAVLDNDYFKRTVHKIVLTRENTKLRLEELGFDFPDSKTNFIFAAHNKVPAKEIYEELKKRNIYVRYWDEPRINNYIRITIGTDVQMEKLFKALKVILNERE